MANYTKEIAHMLDRMLIKVLHQDKTGFYKDKLNYKLSLVELLLLRRLNEEETVKLQSVIDYLEIDRNHMTTALKKLMSYKFVQKVPDKYDGRNQLIVVTDEGRRFLDELSEVSQKELDFVLKDVSINEEKAILIFLSKIVQYHTDKFDPDDI